MTSSATNLPPRLAAEFGQGFLLLLPKGLFGDCGRGWQGAQVVQEGGQIASKDGCEALGKGIGEGRRESAFTGQGGGHEAAREVGQSPFGKGQAQQGSNDCAQVVPRRWGQSLVTKTRRLK